MDEEPNEGQRRRRAFIDVEDPPGPPPAPAPAPGGAPFDDDGYEYEELRPEWSRRRKIGVVAIGVFVVLALLAGAAAWWVQKQIHPSGSAGDVVQIQVPTGSSTAAIADILDEKEIIASAWIFKLYVRFKSAGPFQHGDYQMRKNSDMDDVINTLEGGPLPPPTSRFTVVPGRKLTEIPAQVVDDIPALSADKIRAAMTTNAVQSKYQPAGASLEGFLMPDTYDLAQGADETVVIQTMVAQFDKVADEVGLGEAAARIGLDPYQVLVVASLIEREAKIDEERPLVARVIYNRLANGTPLGVDATLCYLKDQVPCQLTNSDLNADSPYNSRKNQGLPPTPISNVGRASLAAALSPADGPWMYYVLDPQIDPEGNRHLFTDKASEFEAAKNRCRNAGLGCG